MESGHLQNISAKTAIGESFRGRALLQSHRTARASAIMFELPGIFNYCLAHRSAYSLVTSGCCVTSISETGGLNQMAMGPIDCILYVHLHVKLNVL